MKTVRLIVEVEGGCIRAVYGDAFPEGVELDLVIRDHDNIEAGDDDPLTEQDLKDKKNMIHYW